MGSFWAKPLNKTTFRKWYNSSDLAVVKLIVRKQNGGVKGGTGFFISSNGDLMSVNHIFPGSTRIEGIESIQVYQNNNQIGTAELKYCAPDGDVALLKFQPLPPNQVLDADVAVLKFQPQGPNQLLRTPYLKWGNPKKMFLRVGDKVHMLSYPGYDMISFYSFGYVSSECKGTCIADMSSNGGSSGGPVFNDFGDVVGILQGNVTSMVYVVSDPPLDETLLSVRPPQPGAARFIPFNRIESFIGVRAKLAMHVQD